MFKAKKMFSPKKMSAPATGGVDAGHGDSNSFRVMSDKYCAPIHMPAPRPFANPEYVRLEDHPVSHGNISRIRTCLLTGQIEQRLIHADEMMHMKQREYYDRAKVSLGPGAINYYGGGMPAQMTATEVMKRETEYNLGYRIA